MMPGALNNAELAARLADGIPQPDQVIDGRRMRSRQVRIMITVAEDNLLVPEQAITRISRDIEGAVNYRSRGDRIAHDRSLAFQVSQRGLNLAEADGIANGVQAPIVLCKVKAAKLESFRQLAEPVLAI